MKKNIALLLLSSLIGLTVILSACEPAIPHSIERRKDCISCHALDGIRPYPKWHAKRGFGNEVCLNCHELKIKASN